MDLYDRPNSVFVADFIGEANILDCDVLSLGESESSVRIDNYQFAVGNVIPEDREARLAVRPRNIALSSESNPDALSGTVKKVSYVGSHYEYTIVGTFGEVFAIEDATVPSSQRVVVSITFKGGLLPSAVLTRSSSPKQ